MDPKFGSKLVIQSFYKIKFISMDPNFGSIIVIKSFLKIKFMFMDPKFGSIIFLGLHMGHDLVDLG